MAVVIRHGAPGPARVAARSMLGFKGATAPPCQTATFNVASPGS